MDQETFTSASGMWALVWSPASLSRNTRTTLYLHGAGGFGRGMAGLFEYPDLPSLLRDGMELDCRVVIPSCHVGDEWQPTMLSDFLTELESTYDKPSGGYDLVGYSRGGRGVYQFAAFEPARVRTLAAISARDMPELAHELRGFPVFIIHGDKDQRTPVERIRSMYDALRAEGCNCKLEIVDGDHFIIAKVLQDGSIFEWQTNAI